MPFDSFGAVDPDTRRLRAAMTVPPPPGRLWQIDQTIRQLKQHGIWQRLDVLWMLAAHDAQAARLNWKAPASFAMTAVNSPTFTTDRGYAGNGTTSYLDSNYNPAVNAVLLSQNNASFGFWSRSSAATSGSDAGWFGASDGTTIDARSGTDQATYRVFQAAADTVSSITDGSGFYVANRTASNAVALFKNGVSIGSSATASTVPVSNNIYFGRSSAASYHTMQFAVGLIGASLSAGQQLAFDGICRNYLQRIGAA